MPLSLALLRRMNSPRVALQHGKNWTQEPHFTSEDGFRDSFLTLWSALLVDHALDPLSFCSFFCTD